MTAKIVDIDKGWQWKERDPSISSVLDESARGGWHNAHAFPSEIHVELLKAELIPDPYVEFNEHKVQWIGMREWLYTTSFSLGGVFEHAQHFEIVFEGLDTFADVYLNGTNILSSDNQFRTYRLDIEKSALREQNILLLHFKPAYLIGKKLEEEFGRVRAGSCNLGDPSRVYVRKAQYDWRWDWGPELMTVGPYRPIRLIAHTTRIQSIHTKALVSSDLEPSFSLDLMLKGHTSLADTARVTITDTASGDVIRSENASLTYADGGVPSGTSLSEDIVHWAFQKDEVALWWPVGYGKQALYQVEVVLLNNGGDVFDTKTQNIGFRRVRLIQESLQHADQYGKGSTFLFEVNNVRMFIGGSNWIPADNFLTQITAERYRSWLTLLRDGNQNMVRLWGGGVYEPDVFYDICDEFGILVWQDFQFACGIYPAHEVFVENVRQEAEDNVLRLRHHPSLALFCGNNEDYQQILQWGVETDLPARILYETVLPSVVESLTCPQVPYHRGSPYGGKGWDTSDPTIGDVHQWDVWGGKELLWQKYDEMGGRFVSEFGMPSMPALSTIDYWMGSMRDDQKERYAQAPIMGQHCRAGQHERRFAIPMNESFRLTSDLETHVYNTQLMQSEAVSYAYRVWRREWRGKGKEYTGGVIVWQLNDCWPVTSWSIVDYFLRPKPVYYTIARELRPISVGILRSVTKNRETDRPKQFYEFGAFQTKEANISIWSANSTLISQKLRLILSFHDLASSWMETRSSTVTLLPNQSTELLVVHVPTPAADPASGASVVASAKLVDDAGIVVARYADWPQPFKHLNHLGNTGLRVEVSGERIRVSAKKPVKGVVLSVAGDAGEDVKWSDNALDIVPGDDQTIVAKGLGGRGVVAAWLGNERAMSV